MPWGVAGAPFPAPTRTNCRSISGAYWIFRSAGPRSLLGKKGIRTRQRVPGSGPDQLVRERGRCRSGPADRPVEGEELVVLANMEAINSELMREGLDKRERFQRLAAAAQYQLSVLHNLRLEPLDENPKKLD